MRITILALALMMASVLVGAASAQSEGTGPDGSMPATTAAAEKVSGTVVSHDATSLVIRMDSGQEMTLALDTYTYVPSNLAAGQKVTVQYRERNGAKQASMISLESASPGASATGAHSSSHGAPAPASTASPASPAPMGAEGEQTEMPSTASPLGLLALIGIAATGGALALRFLRS